MTIYQVIIGGGGACSFCNLMYQIPKFIPVIFHGLSSFDSHIICKCIGEYEMEKKKITCIKQNIGRYISFSSGNLRF